MTISPRTLSVQSFCELLYQRSEKIRAGLSGRAFENRAEPDIDVEILQWPFHAPG